MTWAQRLKRVFNIDIEVCGRCGGSVRVIACIEDQDVIDRILAHLRDKEQEHPRSATRWHHRPEHHLGHCLFSLGRIPAQQHSISRDATEEFVGIELFVLSFEGERERSTRPAIPVLTTGTARAIFRHFKFRDYSLGNQILSTPLLYFLYFYIDAYEGRDTSRAGQLRWWEATFKDRTLASITTDEICNALEDFASGQALRWDGVEAGGRPKFTSRGTPRKPATVNRMRAALSAVFRFAIEQRLLKRNPVEGIRSRTENNKRVRYLSEAERTALLYEDSPRCW